MEVTVVTRRPALSAQRLPASVKTIGFEGLGSLLPELDYIVLAVPLTDQTRGLIGAEELATMKSTAILVNMARGAVVDEGALFEALSLGSIAGAAIDVWTRGGPPHAGERMYPSEFPFHELDNVLITPHFAGWSTVSRLSRWRTIADNIDRWASGQPLTNVVWGGRGG
jgi:phosphoglycerate dehydrogenase-like enzyme